jgi:hypothetical protein
VFLYKHLVHLVFTACRDTQIAALGAVVGLVLGIGIPAFYVARDERDDERLEELRALNRATKESTGSYMSKEEIAAIRPPHCEWPLVAWVAGGGECFLGHLAGHCRLRLQEGQPSSAKRLVLIVCRHLRVQGRACQWGNGTSGGARARASSAPSLVWLRQRNSECVSTDSSCLQRSPDGSLALLRCSQGPMARSLWMTTRAPANINRAWSLVLVSEPSGAPGFPSRACLSSTPGARNLTNSQPPVLNRL